MAGFEIASVPFDNNAELSLREVNYKVGEVKKGPNWAKQKNTGNCRNIRNSFLYSVVHYPYPDKDRRNVMTQQQSTPRHRDLSRGVLKAHAAGLVRGMGVRMTEYGADIQDGAALEDIIEAMVRIRDLNQETSVETKFWLGDLYNKIPPKYGDRKRIVEKYFGVTAYPNFRIYASVAGRWPEEERCGRYPWNYFKTHNADRSKIGGEDDEGEEGVEKPKKIPPIQALKVVKTWLQPNGNVKFDLANDKNHPFDFTANRKIFLPIAAKAFAAGFEYARPGRKLPEGVFEKWLESINTMIGPDFQEKPAPLRIVDGQVEAIA